jgi:predicted nucleic acid-binding protein
MMMTSKHILLQRAEEQFLNKDYSNALKIYGLLLKDYPQLKDAKVGAYLSDMGFDLDDDAQALFDYYQAIKNSSDDAEEIIDELSQTIYATRIIVQEQVVGAMQEQIEYQDGISYHDFVTLIESKGDFREAFEDIMFSTKVVITTKEEFIDFIKRLISAEYQEVALKYLDSISGHFGATQDIYALYQLIDKV